MSVLDLATRTTGALAWWRALVAAAAMVAAGATAWAILTSRVQAAEARLGSHAAQLVQHDREIRSLQQAQRDLAWNLYVVCSMQAQQLGIPEGPCRRPAER